MLGLLFLGGIAMILGCGFYEVKRMDHEREYDNEHEFDP
jgi:hypothetical protein